MPTTRSPEPAADGRGRPRRRRIRRGEGEVTSWPRGLVDYLPSGPDEELPSPDEDRTRNRLLLAGRLLAVIRSGGAEVDRELLALARAERVLASGDRRSAAELVDRLLRDLDALR